MACLGLVSIGTVTANVSSRVAVPVPAVFVALRATENFPLALVVPEISPVALTLKPAGKPVAAKLVGAPLAAIWVGKGGPDVAGHAAKDW